MLSSRGALKAHRNTLESHRQDAGATRAFGCTVRKGAALILVLWAITVMAMLAGGLSFAIRQDLAISNLRGDRLVAHVLARAGVEQAIAAVMDDPIAVDSLKDDWSDDPAAMEEVELTGGTFTVVHGTANATPQAAYGAVDESSKLNVNAATKEQLMALPKMTDGIAAAIIDWRDADDDPQPEGIEGSYYAGLAHPYKIRNAPLRTMRELLLVRGVTEELLFGEDTNGNGMLDDNEDDGETTPPNDNRDGRLDRGWFAYLTVYSYEFNRDGYGIKRLNIKTADESTLAQRLNLEGWAAKSIVKAREQKSFEHLVDLLDVKRDTSGGQKAGTSEDINSRGEDEKDQPVTLTMFKQLVDRITLKDEELLAGRININTACREVIRMLPEVDDTLAAAIVERRDAVSSFASIGELLDVPGLSKEKFAKLESSVTVRSNVFRIFSGGQSASGLAEATIECVMDRGTQSPRVLYWLESSP